MHKVVLSLDLDFYVLIDSDFLGILLLLSLKNQGCSAVDFKLIASGLRYRHMRTC